MTDLRLNINLSDQQVLLINGWMHEMKRYFTMVIIVAVVAGVAFWLGYRKGYSKAFWDGFRNELGVAHILRKAGLTKEAERQFNGLSDISIYGYFLADKSGQSEKQKQDIERLLVELIRWKYIKGYNIGPQEPLVGMKMRDGTLATEPIPKPFAIYHDRLDEFLKEHKDSIQQAESTVPSKAAPNASSDVR